MKYILVAVYAIGLGHCTGFLISLSLRFRDVIFIHKRYKELI